MRATNRAAGLFAFVALLLAGTASAQPHGGPKGGEMRELRLFLRVAGLTADQKTKVQQAITANREQVKPLWKQMRALRGQIADKLAGSGPVAASDLAPLQQQVAQLREQIDQQFTQTALQIRALLTADQLAKVSQTYTTMKFLREEMRNLVTPPAEAAPAGTKAEAEEELGVPEGAMAP